MATVFIQLGSEEEPREQYLQEAILFLKNEIGVLAGKSPVYETEPWQMDDKQWFLNQVVQMETVFLPKELLQKLKSHEQKYGRKQRILRTTPYERRKIDMDILFYDDRIIHDDDLIVPHPLLHRRRFVLQPLADLAPGWVHPLLKKTIRQLLNECTDEMKIRKYKR